jgi:hypothetical protein
MFDGRRTSLGILALLLVLPQSIYVIGDYLAVGIRFPLFRLQLGFQPVSGAGNATAGAPVVNIITILRELQYIPMGVVGNVLGKTAVATYVWLVGLGMLIFADFLVISWQVLGNHEYARYPGPLILISGGLFLLWAIVQYGPFLLGPTGYSIPVGVPLLWYCGYQFLQAAKGKGESHQAFGEIVH